MQALGKFTRAAVLMLPVLLTSCATMNVNSYRERNFDPQRYRTYAWAPAEELRTGDPRLDNNQIFDAAVREDIERLLASKGFMKAGTGKPDLIVHYHASVSQEIDVRELDRDYDYCENFDCRPYVYDAGTLFIDLVEPDSNRLVWRGWAEGSVDGVIDNQELLDARIAEAVEQIGQQLPRAQ
jgi:hypothetical protein